MEGARQPGLELAPERGVGLGIAGVDAQIAGIIDPHMAGFLGLAALGLLVLRQPDEVWERGDPLTLDGTVAAPVAAAASPAQ